MAAKMKAKTLYQVRMWPAAPRIYSKPVGHKAQLKGRNTALAIVKRLERAGVEAFAIPHRCNVFGA